MDVKREDTNILIRRDTEILAKWWCTLNRYELPEDLPDPEPAESVPGGRRGKIMSFIMAKIGKKECLREWNKDDMNEEEFEVWYENRDGDEYAKVEKEEHPLPSAGKSAHIETPSALRRALTSLGDLSKPSKKS